MLELLIALALVLMLITAGVIRFFRLPPEQRWKKIREWLLYAVTEAEIALGSGTGQLKLVLVYDMMVERFPFLGKCMKFAVFGGLVDSALEEMRNMLVSNKSIAAIVGTKKV